MGRDQTGAQQAGDSGSSGVQDLQSGTARASSHAADTAGDNVQEPRSDAVSTERVWLTDARRLSVRERDATVVELRRQRLRPEQAISVLTNRIAAALVHHEPGWQLPRLSVLARQYEATNEVLTAAIDKLATRGLIRRTPAGQFCRASPADYVLPFGDSLQGLRVRADPVAGVVSVKSRNVHVHPVRDDISCALQIASDEPAWILQLVWAVGGEPAAITVTYLAPRLAESVITELGPAEPDGTCAFLPLTPLAGGDGQDMAGPSWLLPHALHTEMQQPPRWAAQALGLSSCERAVMITAGYGDIRDGKPVALTVAALRPDLLRVTIVSSGQPILAGDTGEVSAGWNHVDGDWDF
ncbi:MAG TPA: hypothetical protein VMA72_00845 [Streptosporangiaceae bacterium]|nr:hypothetical protein [Streptosporangiaceae bacterium]